MFRNGIAGLALVCLSFIAQVAIAGEAQSFVFVENKGQVIDQHGVQRKDIDFKLNTPGMDIFIGNGQVHYQWAKVNPDSTWETYRLDVTLAGANTQAPFITSEPDGYREYYYSHLFPNGMQARSFTKITYLNVYPDIDWVIYTTDNGKALKYDFIVRPGGDIRKIQLRYDGATQLTLNEGALTTATPFGNITEAAPYSYIQGSKETVVVNFLLNNNTVSFNAAKHTGTLVIDPLLHWGTYYGGIKGAGGAAVTTDKAGNVYMGGGTSSNNNIATTGSHKAAYSGPLTSDGYLVKFNMQGQRIWGTYYGGSQNNSVSTVAYDSVYNRIYIAGTSESDLGISTPTGQFQTGSPIYENGFLVQFDTAGVRQWGTFYGTSGSGGGNTRVYRVRTDKEGYVIITGFTANNNGIASAVAHKTSRQGVDGFIARFNTSGVRDWGTYVGGPGTEFPYDIAIDSACNIIMAGYTTSTTDIATPGTEQQTYGGGTTFGDALLVKFNKAGQKVWGTYYGDYNDEVAGAVGLDSANNIYIGGWVTSDTGLSTPGAHQVIKNPVTDDVYFAKFDTSGKRIWSTYYGGEGLEEMNRIEMTPQGMIFLCRTESDTAIATPGIQKDTLTKNSTSDVILVCFDTSGKRNWGTYYGGRGQDYPEDMHYCPVSHSLYISGGSSSTTGIVTPGAYQTTIGNQQTSGQDAFLAKFRMDSVIRPIYPLTDTLICANGIMNVPVKVYGSFAPGNTFTLELSDPTGDFTNPTVIGTLNAQTTAALTGLVPATAAGSSSYRIRVKASSPAYESLPMGYIRVIAAVAPVASIYVSPSATGGPWRTLTFTVVPNNAGPNPTFQWKKNGVDIPGATNNTFIGTTNVDLFTGDKINCLLTSTASCAYPTTILGPEQTVNIVAGVDDIVTGKPAIYPIPNKGIFTVKGKVNNTDAVTLQVYNIAGQLLHAEYTSTTGGMLNKQITLTDAPAGVYMLHIIHGNEVNHLSFTIQK